MSCLEHCQTNQKQDESSIENIYRKIDITAETRFHAARRLSHHSEWSMKLTVAISLFLVLVSLMQILGIGENINTAFTTLFQVFGAVLILIFSIISTMKNHVGAAEKFYSCASELVELKRKIQPCKLSACSANYDQIAGDYTAILKKYETHTVKDFRSDHTRAIAESRHYGSRGKAKKVKDALSWRWGYFLDFSPYVLALLVLIPLLWLICFASPQEYAVMETLIR